MHAAKIAVSIDCSLLKRLDYFVKKRKFKSRSQAVQIAINNTLEDLEHGRLARECEKLNSVSEQRLADEGLYGDEKEWPAF